MSISAQAGAQATAFTGERLHRHIGYRRDIDGLRAIAVLAVVLFHAFPAALPGGFVGVDVFFVISGFLITKVISIGLERGTFTISDFYVRRVRRIFPALLIVLTTCLAFGWKALLAEDFAQLAKHVLGGATFSSNLLLWHEAGYFDKASESKPLLHLWSLGIEEQFYVLWPLLLWWASRRGAPLGKIVAITALLSFGVNVLGVVNHPTATFYSPVSRAWELLLGAGLATPWFTKVVSLATQRQRTTASGAGLALILLAAFGLESARQFPGWWALLPSVGACLIIAAGPTAWVNKAILEKPVMVALGLISFPLYLWHWPLLTFGRTALPENHALIAPAGLLLLSTFLAWGTYELVERPLRFGGKVRQKVLALGASMAAIAVFCLVSLKQAGFPSRYPEIVRTATRYDLNGFQTGIRNRLCFMELDQDASQYAPECVEQGQKPLWLLWGDSGAAAFYPGFRTLANQSGAFRLAQITSSQCPPILGFKSKVNLACEKNNAKALDIARENSVDVIVLAAVWLGYDDARLSETLTQIRDAGVRRIVVLGPLPTWKEAPSQIVFKLWKDDPLHRIPPVRLDQEQYGIPANSPINISGKSSAALDVDLRRVAEQAGATYVSLLDALCDDRGCPMRASNSSGTSFYLDTVHLNQVGSDFAVKAIAERLGIATSR